ncbi:hypothetical protein ACFYVL_14535 [Streptomyces sp. NPDC004111]|uniref:hypothetical protein n=1 Tax=Streptomyces sp. NPDC004111 TaxID=3364690 RepID=UPI0036C52B89
MGDRPRGEEEPSLPDDVWQQFEQDSEARIRAQAPKEPSARARMVAERLRREDEAAAARHKRRLRRRRGPVRARPDAWRAWPESRRRGRNRDWVATLVILGVLVGVLALMYYPWGASYR